MSDTAIGPTLGQVKDCFGFLQGITHESADATFPRSRRV